MCWVARWNGGGPTWASITCAPGAEGRNLDHLCLRVAPFDADAVIAHLAAHGARAGDSRPRFGARGESVSVYAYDPEDNMVEIKGPDGTPRAV